MRLFAGLRPHQNVIKDLAAFRSRLHLGDASATTTDTWHLTVAFIGELDEHRLGDATGALTEATRATAGFRLRLTGGKILGRSATALCVGVDGDLPALHDLVADVRGGLSRFGVPFDERDFTAHLTLARGKDPATAARLSAQAALLDDYRGEPWTVGEVVLYRSRLGPPVAYDVLATFPLSG